MRLCARGFDDARQRPARPSRRWCPGPSLGCCMGCPPRSRTCSTSSPAGRRPRRHPRAQGLHPGHLLRVRRADPAAGAIVLGKTNSPIMGFLGTCDNYLFGPSRNPFDTSKNTGGSSGGSAAAVADGSLPLAEGTDEGRVDPHPGRLVRRVRLQSLLRSHPLCPSGPMPSAASTRSCSRGRSPGRWRTPRSRWKRWLAMTPEIRSASTPTSASPRRFGGPLMAGGLPTAPTSTSSRSTSGSEVVGGAVQAFEQAGAHVEEVRLGIERDQRELSDLWCRLIMPINVETFENCQQRGGPARRPSGGLPTRVPAVGGGRLPAERVGPLPRPADPRRSTTRSSGCWTTTTCW